MPGWSGCGSAQSGGKSQDHVKAAHGHFVPKGLLGGASRHVPKNPLYLVRLNFAKTVAPIGCLPKAALIAAGFANSAPVPPSAT